MISTNLYMRRKDFNQLTLKQKLTYAKEIDWTEEQLDELSKSNRDWDRSIAAANGYNLKELQYDHSKKVRFAVEHFLETFI